jgi:hypothetical protein
MSSLHYDGPRNVLCTPASMSDDVRIQPTPEPTPSSIRSCKLRRQELATITQGKRAEVHAAAPEPPPSRRRRHHPVKGRRPRDYATSTARYLTWFFLKRSMAVLTSDIACRSIKGRTPFFAAVWSIDLMPLRLPVLLPTILL